MAVNFITVHVIAFLCHNVVFEENTIHLIVSKCGHDKMLFKFQYCLTFCQNDQHLIVFLWLSLDLHVNKCDLLTLKS